MAWKLYEGDCLDVMRGMESESVDYVFTDPPYGISFKPQRHDRFEVIEGDCLGNEDLEEFLNQSFSEIKRLLKNNTALHVCSGWSNIDINLRTLKKYFMVKGLLVWKKNNFGIGYHLRPQHELILLAFKGEPRPPEKAPSDVWEFKKIQSEKLLHSCQKPNSLVEKALLLYTKPSDLVLDPFAGSGTTLEVAEQLNRNSVGIEIDPKYCEIIRKRMNNLQQTIFSMGVE